MASKRRLRRKMCGSKQAFASEGNAEACIARLRRERKTTGWLASYRCQFCGAWHIGHPPSSVRQSLSAKARNKAGRMMSQEP